MLFSLLALVLSLSLSPLAYGATEAPSEVFPSAAAKDGQTASTFNLAEVALRRGGGFDLNAEVGISPLSLGDMGGGEFSRRMSLRTDLGYLLVREPAYWGFGATLGLGPRHTFQAGPYVSMVHIWTGLWGSAAFLMNTNGAPVGSFSAGWSVFGAEFQASREEPVLFLKIRIPIGIPLWASGYDRAQKAAAAAQ